MDTFGIAVIGAGRIGSTRSQRHAELADVWAFVLWQVGDPEFQPAAPVRP